MAGTLDTIIIVIIIALGLGIFYKALKEPIDLMLKGIKNGLVWLGSKMMGGTGKTVEVITYG